MAFPGTYNISYYKGDTLEFRVYPKDSAGNPFPLSQYVSPAGTTKFTIAPRRGTLLSGESAVSGYAQISNDQTYILCAITPANGDLLTAGVEYVYDIEIARADANYDFVYTLLTGSISVTEQVTPSAPLETPTAPGPVTALTLGDVTENSISISWSAPTTGGTPDEYYTYIIPYNIAYEDPTTFNSLLGALSLVTPFETTDTSKTFTVTTAISALSIPSIPLVPNTPYIYAVVAHNGVGSSAPVGNFDVLTGTIFEEFTDGGS
jgi:hypothetical protein